MIINKDIWKRGIKLRSAKFEDVVNPRVLNVYHDIRFGGCHFRYGWILTNEDAILVAGGHPYYSWREYQSWKIGDINVFDDVKSLAAYFANNNFFISPSRHDIPRSIFGYSFKYRRFFGGTYLPKRFGAKGMKRLRLIMQLLKKAEVKFRDFRCCKKYLRHRRVWTRCWIVYRVIYLKMSRDVWCKILSLAGLRK